MQQHDNPDHSCTYVLIYTNYKEYTGNGLTFCFDKKNDDGKSNINDNEEIPFLRHLRNNRNFSQ